MLKESFVMLPGVRHRTECKLWGQGLNSWDDFLGAQKVKGLSEVRKESFDFRLKETMHHLKSGNSSFFANMPDQWRLYNEFKHRESTSLMTGGLLYRKPQWGGFSSVLKNHRVTQATGLERA